MATALDLDEELAIQEGSWRGRFISFGILLVFAAFAAAGVYYFFFRDEAAAPRPTEDIAVKRATISQTLIISGTADTQLNSDLTFQSAGRVQKVAVKPGDAVKQGQVLASLESDDLANALAAAQANQRSAQLKLDDLLDGSTAAEIAAAEQAVASAQATLTKAENDYTDLTDGPSASELAAAQQGVDGASAQLASAQATLEKLKNTPSASDLAAAQAGVALAQSSLTAAQNSAANAADTLASAASGLTDAEASYCAADAAPAFCTTPATPISSADATLMNAALGGVNSALASAVIAANDTYRLAVNGKSSADAAVVAAQDGYDSAQAKLDAVNDGPSSEDMDAAEAAVTSAEAGLASAEAKLTDLQDGPTDLQISTALAAGEAARAALAAAQDRLDETRNGPTANMIAQARQAVRTAAISVEGAQIRLRNAQITAPFDGTVAAVNIEPGEFASAAGATPAIVLLTPDALLLNMQVGETDYPNLKVDQGGVVIFDGIPGQPYPFRITEIGLSPTSTQGVVTYTVKGSLAVLPGSPRPAPGMNARGQITTSSKADVLVVPPRAIRRRGTELVVDVRRNGRVEEQVVTTGVTDSENVEVLTGLAEGDLVVVPSLTSAATSGQNKALQTPLPNNIR